MDEYLRNRFRILGVCAVIVLTVFCICLLFLQLKEKKNTSMKLRSFYSDMVQALLISKNTNGPPGEWGFKPGYKNVELLNNNLFNYLKVQENCSSHPGHCIPNLSYKSIKDKDTNVNLYKFPSVKLANGIAFAVETIGLCKKHNDLCALIYVDLNSVEAPNIFGKDMFVFAIINNGTVAFVPYNDDKDIDYLKNDINYGCNKKSKIAMNCAALIKNSNWQINASYPW